MRYAVYGAGAIGAAIGGKLHQAGREVVLIARGSNLEVLETRGLTLQTPDDEKQLSIEAVASPREVPLGPGDVVLLAEDPTASRRTTSMARSSYLGRLHGVPTPVNEGLCLFARQIVTAREEPGSADPDAIEKTIAALRGPTRD
jgi:Ketopantoate reductase PanE/ApbA